MNYIFWMLAILMVGGAVLMLGILLDREPGQSIQSALNNSLIWGLGFIFSFGAELWCLPIYNPY